MILVLLSLRTKTSLGPSLLVQHVVNVCSFSVYLDSQDTEGRRRSVRDAEPSRDNFLVLFLLEMAEFDRVRLDLLRLYHTLRRSAGLAFCPLTAGFEPWYLRCLSPWSHPWCPGVPSPLAPPTCQKATGSISYHLIDIVMGRFFQACASKPAVLSHCMCWRRSMARITHSYSPQYLLEKIHCCGDHDQWS